LVLISYLPWHTISWSYIASDLSAIDSSLNRETSEREVLLVKKTTHEKRSKRRLFDSWKPGREHRWTLVE